MKKLVGFQKGVNLGGWLSQGSKEYSHLDSFIHKEDIKRIYDMGCDHLRLPIDFENIETEQGYIEKGFEYITNCILWAKEYGLNVVLDLHKTPGYIFDDPEYSKNFFGNPVLEGRFLDIWNEISKRYKEYSSMLMLEMLNEVTSFDYSDQWNALALKCIQVIRKNMPDVYILYGGVGYSAVNAVKLMAEPYDDKIVYNIHCYEPIIFTHQGAYWMAGMPLDYRVSYPIMDEEGLKIIPHIPAAAMGPLGKNPHLLMEIGGVEFFKRIFKEPVEIAEERGVPLYCGEYGAIDLADPKSTLMWIKDIHQAFEYYGIGRALWNYKEKDFGLIGEHYASIYDEMIQYL